MILRKYSMSPNKNFEIGKIVKILHNISEYEKCLVNELIEYLNGTLNKKIIAAKDEYEWDKSFKADNFIQIDLSNFYNNRAYAKDIENTLRANYNNNNEFCVVKKRLEDNRLVYENAKFKVNIADETEKYDNFGCNEQVIGVSEGNYTDLLVIASAQFGAQKTEVKLDYSDGTYEFVPLMISDWRSGSAFGEYDIYEGFCYKIVNEVKNIPQGNSHLYLQRISIDSKKN